jgi:CRP-like cAMP-binding protein
MPSSRSGNARSLSGFSRLSLPRGNRLLDALSDADSELLRAHARLVELRAGDSTAVARMPMHSVDFPLDALMSVEGALSDGSTFELASIGNEAFVEIDAALDCDVALRTAYCRFPGRAVRVALDDFQAALRANRPFAARVRHAVRARVFVTEQNQMCNLRHLLPQRLARWLLVTSARLGQSQFGVTHDLLAVTLGSRRPSVTDAAAVLEQAGAIERRRGAIVICDVERLERACCECYEACREAIEAGLSQA